MLIQAIKSKTITSKDTLFETITEALGGQKRDGKSLRLKERDILVITSKVVAIMQGKTVPCTNKEAFEKLVHQEADKVFGWRTAEKKSHNSSSAKQAGAGVLLTIKNGILIPWAGIDRSNTQKGTAILWPKDPFEAAHELCQKLKKHYKLKKLGVLITDSTCSTLRRGVTGIALGYAGFRGVNDLRGTKDIYGNPLKVSQQNVADMLAAAANLLMGEGKEKTPFALVRGAPATFTSKKPDPQEPVMPQDECLYAPLYNF